MAGVERTRAGFRARSRGRTGPRGPLRYPAFRTALASRAASGLGTWMQVVAAGWLVYDITGSAAAVGALTVASKGPGLLLSAWGGELADRYDRRRVIAVSSLAQAALGLVLVLLALDGIESPFLIYAPVLGMGIAAALGNPAGQGLATTTVPPELAQRATGIFSVTYNVSRLAGPALAGVIVAGAGVAPCFAINAVSDLLVAGLALVLPASAANTRARAPHCGTRSVRRSGMPACGRCWRSPSCSRSSWLRSRSSRR